ncbi:MAG: hypothetical protein NZ554_14040, partial [Bryobacteraceae bacterium]|nr:hypothetical protein [Bryobacteraceae bacterium]
MMRLDLESGPVSQCAAQSVDKPGKRTLYLDATRTLRVVRDGCTLRVVRPGRIPVLYPLGQVTRVIVFGGADWDVRALLTWPDLGIPVIFVQAEGDLNLFCWMPNRYCLYDEELTRILDKLLSPALYQQWRQASERREMLAVLERFRLQLRELDAAQVATLLYRRAALGWIRTAHEAMQFWRRILAAHVACKVA